MNVGPHSARGTLAQRFCRRERMLGMQLFSGSPNVAEILGSLDYDLVMLDREHTVFGPERISVLIRAASSFGLPTLVRVPAIDDSAILTALDCGADGIILPRVRSADDIRAARKAAFFPPVGNRGMCPDVRAARYSFEDWQSYCRDLEQRITLVPLIEDAIGVEQVENIIAENVDAVFFGPADFGMSIGAGARALPTGSRRKPNRRWRVSSRQRRSGGFR